MYIAWYLYVFDVHGDIPKLDKVEKCITERLQDFRSFPQSEYL